MIPLFVSLVLLGSGPAAGGLAISALGGAPLLLTLPTDTYIPIHQFLVKRFDPFMPICLVTGLLSGVVLTFLTDGPARVFAGIGALSLIAALTVSLTKNVPINRWVETLDPAAPPADWQRVDPRIRWRNWNLVRTTLAAVALVANVSAVATLL